MESWLLFLLLTVGCVLAQGFFSMFEMSCLSFNKIRLQYYISKKQKKATWINQLLNRPSRFFGTTLITVNLFLQLGSELSRRFYDSLHINPDFAPFTQIFIVVIFAELAPLFAARRHPESIAMFAVPVVFLLSKLLIPLTWIIDQLNRGIHKLVKAKSDPNLFLSREEIQKAFEEKMESPITFGSSFDNFFALRNKNASQLMVPIDHCPSCSSSATVGEITILLEQSYLPFLPLYHKTNKRIVGIMHTKDLLSLEEKKKVMEIARPPWFITEKDTAFSILRQFQTNNQSVAIVLNIEGEAVGMITFDQLIDQILGPSEEFSAEEMGGPIIEKTLPGDMLIAEFNEIFPVKLVADERKTLSDFIIEKLQHHPDVGERLRLENLEFTMEEVTLFEVKLVNVKTI